MGTPEDQALWEQAITDEDYARAASYTGSTAISTEVGDLISETTQCHEDQDDLRSPKRTSTNSYIMGMTGSPACVDYIDF